MHTAVRKFCELAPAVLRVSRRSGGGDALNRRHRGAPGSLRSAYGRALDIWASWDGGPAAAFAFAVPDGWRTFTDIELRRRSHAYGLRVWNGLVPQAEPYSSEIVVLCTPGRLLPSWSWPPNRWPGYDAEFRQVSPHRSIRLAGEHAILSQYAVDGVSSRGDAGIADSKDPHEAMSVIDVTAGHRGRLYKVLLVSHSAALKETDARALGTAVESWRWDARLEASFGQFSDVRCPLLGVTAWNQQCSAFTFGVPAGWRHLSPRELERASPLKEERVWAGILCEDPDLAAKIEVTAQPGRLHSAVRGTVEEALAATSSVSLVDGPWPLEIDGRTAVSLHYVCLLYGWPAPADAQSSEVDLPEFGSLTVLMAEWQGWIYRIRMYGRERDAPRLDLVLSTVVQTWHWERN